MPQAYSPHTLRTSAMCMDFNLHHSSLAGGKRAKEHCIANLFLNENRTLYNGNHTHKSRFLMVHFLKIKISYLLFRLETTRQLPYQFQCLTGHAVRKTWHVPLLLRIWAEKRCTTAIKRGISCHAPVLGEEWLFLLSPRTDTFPVTDSAMPIAYRRS